MVDPITLLLAVQNEDRGPIPNLLATSTELFLFGIFLGACMVGEAVVATKSIPVGRIVSFSVDSTRTVIVFFPQLVKAPDDLETSVRRVDLGRSVITLFSITRKDVLPQPR